MLYLFNAPLSIVLVKDSVFMLFTDKAASAEGARNKHFSASKVCLKANRRLGFDAVYGQGSECQRRKVRREECNKHFSVSKVFQRLPPPVAPSSLHWYYIWSVVQTIYVHHPCGRLSAGTPLKCIQFMQFGDFNPDLLTLF